MSFKAFDDYNVIVISDMGHNWRLIDRNQSNLKFSDYKNSTVYQESTPELLLLTLEHDQLY